MTGPRLFEPIAIGGLALANRIVIAPMCQYSANEGDANEWHLIHLGQLSQSGAGLLTIEATAVLAEGRITAGDLGLWSDANERALGQVLDAVRRRSAMPIALQLSHAGRKASTRVPWRGGGQVPAGDACGWRADAPSPLAFGDHSEAPAALDRDGIARIRDAFVAAARRAARLGLDALQLHAAHGYLMHQFLSPLSNRRDDEFGGTLENRMRLPLELFSAVRDAFPAERPVTVRISATDWVEGGWNLEGTLTFVAALEARGCGAVHVTSGGLDARQAIPVAPGYQVPFARAVKVATSLPVVAVGLITAFDHAEAIITAGDADLIALARGMLWDPRWPWHAAAHLGASVVAPEQYLRARPHGVGDVLRARENGVAR